MKQCFIYIISIEDFSSNFRPRKRGNALGQNTLRPHNGEDVNRAPKRLRLSRVMVYPMQQA
jgi:hypothetical protein